MFAYLNRLTARSIRFSAWGLLALLLLAACFPGAIIAQPERRASAPAQRHARPPSPSTHGLARAQELRRQALALIRKPASRDLDAAVSRLDESARIFENLHLSEAAAEDYLDLGKVHFIRSRFKPALEAYRRGLRLAGDSSPGLACMALSRISFTYSTVGDFQQASTYSQQIRECGAATANPQVRVQASEALILGLVYTKNSDALMELTRALVTAVADSGDSGVIAQSLYWEGMALYLTGATTKAIEKETAALRLSKSAGNIHDTARIEGLFAMLMVVIGEPDKAATNYAEALRIFDAIGDEDGVAITLNGLGLLNLAIGDHIAAVRNFEKALAIFTRLNDLSGQMSSASGAAQAEWKLGNYVKSQQLQKLVLKYSRKFGEVRTQATALAGLGDYYTQMRRPELAEKYYLLAVGLCRSTHHVVGEAEHLIQLGHFYATQGRLGEALTILREALQPAMDAGRVANLASIHFETAAVYRKMGDLEKARLEIEQTIQIIESQRIKVTDYDSRATYFSSVHNYYQLYIGILMDLHKRAPGEGYARKAFEASERSKVRALLDMLAGETGCVEAPQSHGLGTGAQAPQQRNNAVAPRPTGSKCASSAPAPLTLSEVQSEIRGDNAVLLEYALGGEKSYLWAVDESGITACEIAGAEKVSRLVRRLLTALTARQRHTGVTAIQYSSRVAEADRHIRRYSADVARMLLAPAEHLLAKDRVIIVPDGIIHHVPFAVLPIPGGRNAPPNMVTLPSASILNAIRLSADSHSPPDLMAAVFADPVYNRNDTRVKHRGKKSVKIKETRAPEHPGFDLALRVVGLDPLNIARLEESSNETHEFLESLPKDKVWLALGFDANRDAVLKGDLGRYRYVHFAAHGLLLDTVHLESPGLVLSLLDENGNARDGILRLKDIYGLNLSADLVVLSSCESALGKELSSEGTIGLPRAFLSAGARGVVSSLWKVDDAPTAAFMKNFYGRLRAGERPAAALRGAQHDMAASPEVPDWKNPFFWAAFTLQGDYR